MMKTLVVGMDELRADMKTIKMKQASLSLSCADLTQKDQFNGETVSVMLGYSNSETSPR